MSTFSFSGFSGLDRSYIIFQGKIELVALLWLSFWCLVTVSVLWFDLGAVI